MRITHAIIFLFACIPSFAAADISVHQGTVTLKFDNGSIRHIDFYADNIFRVFQDGDGGSFRDPKAHPEARILVDNPRKETGKIDAIAANEDFLVTSKRIQVRFNKSNGCMTVKNLENGRIVLTETAPPTCRSWYQPQRVLQTVLLALPIVW